jgi:hypothetical protein
MGTEPISETLCISNTPQTMGNAQYNSSIIKQWLLQTFTEQYPWKIVWYWLDRI